MSLSLRKSKWTALGSPPASRAVARGSGRSAPLIALAAFTAALSSACSDDGPETESGSGTTTTTTTTTSTTTSDPECVPKDGPLPHDKLSDYCYFKGDLKDLSPADNAVPYDVAAALWSDHAAKQRLIVLPEGEKAHFDEGEDWVYPIGTTFVKTFSFYDDFRDLSSPHRILETRLLVLEESGWKGHVYVWNAEQTEAVREVAGERVDVHFIDEDGNTTDEEYIIPNTNQCKSCHERDDAMTFLGPFTQQLNRPVTIDGKAQNQLTYLASRGVLDAALPPLDTLAAFPDPFGDGPLDARARAYLHANCSHCHRPGGGGGSSGLVLLDWEHTPAKNGVCKQPAAAGSGTGGHQFDIVPGNPDESIMVFRMGSTDPEIKMPELPNRVPDSHGVELIRSWIAAMPPDTCK